MSLTRHILNIKAPDGASWSGKWRKAKRAYYKKYGKVCKCCGASKKKDKIELHHKLPRHLFPELALAEDNFISLCNRKGVGCHFRHGHMGNYHNYNQSIKLVAHYVRNNSIKVAG